MKTITQQELKENFHYNQDTGVFTRLKTPSSNAIKGSIVGTKHPLGYLTVSIKNKEWLLHRLAWLYVFGNFPVSGLDHKNEIRTDNRILNLREASKQENGFNRGVQKNNTSGFKGVTWSKFACKWASRAVVNGKSNHIGYFNTAEEAANAYQEFAKNNHGEFYNSKNVAAL